MTSLPDWLVERAALDEIGPAHRERIARADPRELADRIAAVRAETAAELTHHPAGPAVAQIEAQVLAQARQRAELSEQQRRRLRRWLGLATSALAIVVVVGLASRRAQVAPPGTATPAGQAPDTADDESTRIKGAPRLAAFRLVGDQVERLTQDAIVSAGDIIQLRYTPVGQRHGVIASVDGAGVVTLHFPLHDDAPPEATAMAPDTTALPNAYALDDAPRFERFFFVTAASPIDVREVLAAARSLARQGDSATASLELPAGLRQWSLRLRKADRPSTDHDPSDSSRGTR